MAEGKNGCLKNVFRPKMCKYAPMQIRHEYGPQSSNVNTISAPIFKVSGLFRKRSKRGRALARWWTA